MTVRNLALGTESETVYLAILIKASHDEGFRGCAAETLVRRQPNGCSPTHCPGEVDWPGMGRDLVQLFSVCGGEGEY